MQISCTVTSQQISIFVFASTIPLFPKVQSLYFLNPNFQTTPHLLWLYSLVCVGLGWNAQRQVFSECGSFVLQMSLGQRVMLTCPSNLGYGKRGFPGVYPFTMIIYQGAWALGYNTFFMLNSAKHEIYSAHKC